MKLFFQIISKMFLILTILTGCATTEEIEETDPLALLNKGAAFAEKGQYERAIAYFSEAIERNPRYAEAYNDRGAAYYDKGQYDKAISDFTKAIELNPKHAMPYYNRGNAYDEKGQYDKAISDYNKAIEIKPRYAKAYTNRGTVYVKISQHDKAISDFNKAIELNPKLAEAYSNRGFVYMVRFWNKNKACSDWKQACELGDCRNYERAKKKVIANKHPKIFAVLESWMKEKKKTMDYVECTDCGKQLPAARMTKFEKYETKIVSPGDYFPIERQHIVWEEIVPG